MSKTKPPRKKYRPPNPNVVKYVETKFLYTEEDSTTLTLNVYLRLLDYKAGTAVPADRTTLMIRLHAGFEMLKNFDHDGVEETLLEALTIVRETKVNDPMGLRGFNPAQQHVVGLALALIHQMFEQVDLWEQAKAVKAGEDRCLIGADKYEYVLVKFVDE